MNRFKKTDLTNHRISFWVFLLVLSILLMSFGSIAQSISKSTVIRNVRIFDGERMISRGTVVVKDGKIIEVGKDVNIPDESEIINGEGQTLLPGLIDAHVHVLYPQVLKQFLIFGVTSVIDMHMVIKTMKDIKKSQASGKANDTASLISAGTLTTAPGGHGTQFFPIPTITSPEEAQAFVDDRIEEGSDFIKIIYDDGSAFSNELPTLDKSTLTAVIKAAHKRDKLAVVHIMTLREAKEAIEAGADGLAHLFCDDAYDEEFGRMVAKHNAFVIPTLTVLKSISGITDASILVEDHRLSPFLKQMDIAYLRQPFPSLNKAGKAGYKAAEKAVQQLKSEGVPLLAGTDVLNAGSAYGASLHHELELLVRAGLTPVEALTAATSAPAKIFNLTDRGRIQSGLNADLLLVKGNPTKDIKATRDIIAVWKNGLKVDREMYRASVEKDRAAAERQRSLPPPEGSESGLISDFEAEEITANFGSGWTASTDAIMGGKSKAEFRWTEGGAQGSKGSMLITGTIDKGGPFSWAGVIFSPGPRSMSPVNLSSKKAISFWAKGDIKTCYIMIFARSRGFSPSIISFAVEPEWKHFTFPFISFGTDGSDIMGIFLGATKREGKFSLQIDKVRLK